MAEYLASIFGTEKDKVNCSFYFKIGACRHGDRCSRIHNKPTFSQTLVLQNLYINPQNSAKTADGSHIGQTVSDEEMQEHYHNFFEEVFIECECTRAGFCNFMHLKPISRDLRRDLYKRMPGDGRIKRSKKKKGKEEGQGGKENKENKNQKQKPTKLVNTSKQ